jgi:hypothetical protein
MSKKTRIKDLEKSIKYASKVGQEVKEEEEIDEDAIAIEDVVIPVKILPKAKRRRSPIYDRVLDKIMESPKGSYQIQIEWKQIKSVYQGLAKRIKTNEKMKKTLRLRMLEDKLFIQKLE